MNFETLRSQKSNSLLMLMYVLLFVFFTGSASSQTIRQITPTVAPTGVFYTGQVDCFAVNPLRPETILIGTKGNGVWRSYNSGESWQKLPMTYTSATISGSSAQQMIYGNHSIRSIEYNTMDTNSIAVGVLFNSTVQNNQTLGKDAFFLYTTDGGSAWLGKRLQDTSVSAFSSTVKIAMNGTDTSRVYVINYTGNMSILNGGFSATGVVIQTGCYDIVYKPQSSLVAYISTSSGVRKTTNNGATFAPVGGLPTIPNGFYKLVVTPNEPMHVWAVGVQSNGAFASLYRSLDEGSTWTNIPNVPNVFGANIDGSSTSGTANLACVAATSIETSSTLYLGSRHLWRTSNAGVSWECRSIADSSWKTNTKLPALLQQLVVGPREQRLYMAHQAGMSISSDSAQTWSSVTHSVPLWDCSKLQLRSTQSSPTLVVSLNGNRSLLRRNSTWTYREFDSIQTYIDASNAQYIITADGKLYRSNDSGLTYTANITPAGLPNRSGVTPWSLNPHNNRTLYIATRGIRRSSDKGNSWVDITTDLPSVTYRGIAVASHDTSVIYVWSDSALYRTDNRGTDWSSIRIFPRGSVVTVSPHDSRRISIALNASTFTNSLGNATPALLMTTNGGETWTTYSLESSPNDLARMSFVATTWKNDGCGENLFLSSNYGLRSVEYLLGGGSQTLQKNAANDTLSHYRTTFSMIDGDSLIVATSGAGVYSRKLQNPGPKPQIRQSKKEICFNESIEFSDATQVGPGFRFWSFPGGSPSESNDSVVDVRYSGSGVYRVQLRIRNECGQDSIAIDSAVIVYGRVRPEFSLMKTDYCVGDTLTFIDKSTLVAGLVRTWEFTGGDVISLSGNPKVLYSRSGVYTARLQMQNFCSDAVFELTNIRINEYPSTPVITRSSDSILTVDSSSDSYQWYLADLPISGATKPQYIVKTTGTYYVTRINAGGCRVVSSPMFVERIITSVSTLNQPQPYSIVIQPSPAVESISVTLPQAYSSDRLVRIRSLVGKDVFQMSTNANSSAGDSETISIPISNFANGVYILEVLDGNIYQSKVFVKQD